MKEKCGGILFCVVILFDSMFLDDEIFDLFDEY
jgi:hypothetical protein